ncbi:MAG: hypothetical protein KDG50_15070 [Chromatiales bacterium]|nr:hypothetical protein [Chromatiales bacterium]
MQIATSLLALAAAMASAHGPNVPGACAAEAERTTWFQRHDRDQNGGLTIGEFAAFWAERRRRTMVRDFQWFDTDGDGALTAAEFDAPPPPGPQAGPPASRAHPPPRCPRPF